MVMHPLYSHSLHSVFSGVHAAVHAVMRCHEMASTPSGACWGASRAASSCPHGGRVKVACPHMAAPFLTSWHSQPGPVGVGFGSVRHPEKEGSSKPGGNSPASSVVRAPISGSAYLGHAPLSCARTSLPCVNMTPRLQEHPTSARTKMGAHQKRHGEACAHM